MRTLLIVAVVTGAAVASADPPRYTRKPNVQIDVKLSARTRPLEPHELPPAKPAVNGSDILVIEEKREPYRRGQERLLEKLVANTPDDDPQKPDLLFRLAELYAKQQRFWRLEGIDAEVTKE